MPATQAKPMNRYSAPLAEKTADELLLAIRKGQSDADECRQQLHRDGWTDEHIAAALAPKPLHEQHSAAVTSGRPCTCGCGLNR